MSSRKSSKKVPEKLLEEIGKKNEATKSPEAVLKQKKNCGGRGVRLFVRARTHTRPYRAALAAGRTLDLTFETAGHSVSDNGQQQNTVQEQAAATARFPVGEATCASHEHGCTGHRERSTVQTEKWWSLPTQLTTGEPWGSREERSA